MSEERPPRFDGTGNARGWLTQCDQYFATRSWLKEDEKVMWMTTLFLHGEAFHWWFSDREEDQRVTWETFKIAFIKKFVPGEERTMGMPRFDGSGDAYWWLIQTRKYLESAGLPEESWLSFVDLGLDGEARDWFDSWRKINQKVEFLQFVGDLLIKFKPEFGRYFQDVEEETVAPTETAMKPESRTTLEQQLKDEEPVLEKERVPLAQESKREGMLIKKQQTEASPKKSNKPEVKTKLCRAQIWSKQNIALALKMRGITAKWKKSRARTDPRIIVKEGIQANRTRETSNQAIPLPRREADRNKKRKQQVRHRLRTRRVICRPPPKPPDRNVRGGGNIEVLTTKRKRGSCVWVARPPPKPPDGHNCKGCCDYRNWLLCAGPKRNSRTTSNGKSCKRKRISPSPTTRNYKLYRSHTTPNASRTRPCIGQHLPLRLEDKSVFQGGSIDRPLVCGVGLVGS